MNTRNEMIVSFCHSNYMINSYGTEKFIRELSSSLYEEGYHHLNFFSFYHQYGKVSVGVIYDDKFCGIYDYKDIKDIIGWYIKKEHVVLRGIHVQHFLNHDMDELKRVIDAYAVPVYVFVHDFFLVCNNYKLIDSKNRFCGVSQPNPDKCKDCENKAVGLAHFDKITFFIREIDANLVSFITPSAYVAEGIAAIFKDQKDKIIIRPHLCHEGHWNRPSIDQKIKIAYAGLQVADKGYEAWKTLVKYLGQKREYEFFYFGTGTEKLPGVKNVYVSVAQQGEDAMARALKNEGIDVALMWTMCPESYSYVYYELSVCGIYILTNKNSGNVCKAIEQNKNGKVFASLEDCKKALMDFEFMKQSVNEYRKDTASFCPRVMKKNTSLVEVLPGTKERKPVENIDVKRPRKMGLKTMAYLLKHSKKI